MNARVVAETTSDHAEILGMSERVLGCPVMPIDEPSLRRDPGQLVRLRKSIFTVFRARAMTASFAMI